MPQLARQHAPERDGDPIMKESGVTYHWILRFIVSYKKEHDGNSPSYRQIALRVGRCLATVAYHIESMRNLGLIRPGTGGQRPLELEHGRYDYGDDIQDDV